MEKDVSKSSVALDAVSRFEKENSTEMRQETTETKVSVAEVKA